MTRIRMAAAIGGHGTAAGPGRSAAAGARRRHARTARDVVILGIVLTVAIALVVGAGYACGFRANVQTRSIPAPPAQASPDQVVLAYVDAYNHRDFRTMKTIYPSEQGAFSRFGVLGTMRDVRIVQSRAATEDDLSGTSPEPGHSYYRVQVALTYAGLAGSDLAYQPGPNGWTYRLERSDATLPWVITDHGNG